MQNEILTFQFGNFTNRVLESWWNLENHNYDEDNEEFYKLEGIFIKGNLRRPRLLIYELQNDLEKYKLFEKKNINNEYQKLKNKSNLWDKEKIKLTRGEEEEIKEEILSEKKQEEESESYRKFDLTTRNFMMLPQAQNYFNLYSNGRDFLQNSILEENMEDSVRYFLEESDMLDGFQFFYDVHSGYGIINKYIQDYLRQECPKLPILEFGFENEFEVEAERKEYSHDLKMLNKFISTMTLKEQSTAYIPIQHDLIHDFQGLDKLAKSPYSLYSLIISNTTFPYRRNIEKFKGLPDMHKYLGNLLPYPELNLFNVFYEIPNLRLIEPYDIITSNGTKKVEGNNIFSFKHKPKSSTLSFNFSDPKKLTEYHTIKEAYTIRGYCDRIKLPRDYDPDLMNLSFSDNFILLTEQITMQFEESIWKEYGKLDAEKELHLESIPFHSVLYNGEAFGVYLQNMVNKYKTCSKNAKEQFKKDKFEDDDFKEMEDSYKALIDAYKNVKSFQASE